MLAARDKQSNAHLLRDSLVLIAMDAFLFPIDISSGMIREITGRSHQDIVFGHHKDIPVI
jgi:hypothetical protein